MQTIGLLGGMSWESSLSYYKLINTYTNDILGGQNNAKSVMVTVNFEEIEKLQHHDKWDESTQILLTSCLELQNANADFIVICTNTMHKLLPQIEKYIEGVILGCTEIGLLVSQDDFEIKVFDTTKIHAKQAVEYALKKSSFHKYNEPTIKEKDK